MEKAELIQLRKKFLNHRLDGVIKAVYDAYQEKDDFVSCTEVYRQIEKGGYLPEGFEFEKRELFHLLKDYFDCGFLEYDPRVEEIVPGKEGLVLYYKPDDFSMNHFMEDNIRRQRVKPRELEA